MSPSTLKTAALLSLAPSLLLPTHAATATTPSPWPDHQSTYDPQKVFDNGPLNAILIPGTSFLPHRTPFDSTPSPTLPASCYNCNPAGCMCSTASLLSLNNTDVGQLVNVCEVCRDAPWGMVCFCAESQWTASHVCGSDSGKSEGGVDPKTGDVCRLNREGMGRVLRGRENVYAPGVTITPNGVQVGGASAGGSGTGSKSGAGKVGAGGVAAIAAVLGTGAAMAL